MIFDITPVTSPHSTDCGATCLKMLLNYYGIEADLNELIKDCNTGLAGCNAKDILQAGKAHGLHDLAAYKTDAEDLYSDNFPSIVWWKYRHFCVFCGVDENDQVVICNPDRGRYHMSKNLFQSFYSGVSLSAGG